MDFEWAGVPAEGVVKIWPVVVGLVKAGLKESQGEYDEDDIYRHLLTNEMQLWIMGDDSGIKAVVVTQIQPMPQYDVCWVILAAGMPLKRFIAIMPEVIEKWAAHMGCRRIRFFGREGWKKAPLPGWSSPYVVMEKVL